MYQVGTEQGIIPKKLKFGGEDSLEINKFLSFTQDLRPLLLLLPSAISSESRRLVNLPFVILLRGNCKLIRLCTINR